MYKQIKIEMIDLRVGDVFVDYDGVDETKFMVTAVSKLLGTAYDNITYSAIDLSTGTVHSDINVSADIDWVVSRANRLNAHDIRFIAGALEVAMTECSTEIDMRTLHEGDKFIVCETMELLYGSCWTSGRDRTMVSHHYASDLGGITRGILIIGA